MRLILFRHLPWNWVWTSTPIWLMLSTGLLHLWALCSSYSWNGFTICSGINTPTLCLIPLAVRYVLFVSRDVIFCIWLIQLNLFMETDEMSKEIGVISSSELNETNPKHAAKIGKKLSQHSKTSSFIQMENCKMSWQANFCLHSKFACVEFLTNSQFLSNKVLKIAVVSTIVHLTEAPLSKMRMETVAWILFENHDFQIVILLPPLKENDWSLWIRNLWKKY